MIMFRAVNLKNSLSFKLIFIYRSNTLPLFQLVSAAFFTFYSRLYPLLEVVTYISKSFNDTIYASAVLYFEFDLNIRWWMSFYCCNGNKYGNLSKTLVLIKF